MTAKPPTRFILLTLVTVAVATLTVPGALSEYAAGSIVGKSDYDYTPWPADKSDKISLCVVDLDGNGAYGSGEPVYVDIDSTTCADGVEPKDLRLTAFEDLPAGKEVKSSNADAGLAYLGPLTHQIKYVDVGGAGEWDSDGTLYLDLVRESGDRVDIGDIRVTPFGDAPALSAVSAGDADQSMPLADINSGGKALTDANMFYKAGSCYYINTSGKVINTAKFGVSDKDVRLIDKAIDLDVPTSGSPSFSFSDLEVMRPAATPGAPFQVKVTATNTGDGAAAGLLETTLDGQVVDSRGTPTLATGESVTLVMTLFAPIGSDQVTLGVGDLTLTVPVTGTVGDASLSEVTGNAADASTGTSAADGSGAEPAGPSARVNTAPGGPFGLVVLLVCALAVMAARGPRSP